jgi:predicted ester cyclase
MVTADFVDHGAPPGLPPGPDGYIAVLRLVTEVLRIRYEVHDVVAEGERVAIRATAHGVHATDHLGVPATGKPYAMHTMHLYRAEGDRLAEHWGVRDEHSVLVQVGALPAPVLPPGAGGTAMTSPTLTRRGSSPTSRSARDRPARPR